MTMSAKRIEPASTLFLPLENLKEVKE